MHDPAINALVKLKARLDEHAHGCMQQPKGGDPFSHGVQVGTYAGLTEAVAVIEDAMSAREDADAKL